LHTSEEAVTVRIHGIAGLGWPYTTPFDLAFHYGPSGQIDVGCEAVQKVAVPHHPSGADTSQKRCWLRTGGCKEQTVGPNGFIV